MLRVYQLKPSKIVGIAGNIFINYMITVNINKKISSSTDLSSKDISNVIFSAAFMTRLFSTFQDIPLSISIV
jgi:hypothetical protein